MDPLGTLTRFAIFGYLISSCTGTANVSITQTNEDRTYSPGDLVFADEFDSFNLETWSHEHTLGGVNYVFEMRVNSRENSYVRDGILFIKPTLTSEGHGDDFVFAGQLTIQGGENEDCTNSMNFGCFRSGNYPRIINPAVSARIHTMDSFYLRYGRVVVRAKLPTGDWLWPSVRLEPRFNAYGSWPHSGFINILESRGNRRYVLISDPKLNAGVELASSSIIYGPHPERRAAVKAEKFSKPDQGFDRDFHIYEFEWTDDHLSFYVDGELTKTIHPPDGGFWQHGGFEDWWPNPWKSAPNKRMAPFDQKFFLTLGVTVGGTEGYFPDEWFENLNGRKPWHNGDQTVAFFKFYEALDEWYPTWDGEESALQVDYIRVYAV